MGVSAGESCKSVIMEEEAAIVREAEGKAKRTACLYADRKREEPRLLSHWWEMGPLDSTYLADLGSSAPCRTNTDSRAGS